MVPLEQQIIRTAHHEAGHIVVAAAQSLRLRPEGLSVDERGEDRIRAGRGADEETRE